MTSVEVAALSARFGIRFSCLPQLSGPLTVTSSEHKGDEIREWALNADLAQAAGSSQRQFLHVSAWSSEQHDKVGAFDPEVPPLADAALESLQTKRATRTTPARSS
jgi:hypothetical protein